MLEQQILELEKNKRTNFLLKNFVFGALVFTTLLVVGKIVEHKNQPFLVSFHSTGTDINWGVVGNGYCQTKCSENDYGLDSCDPTDTESYSCVGSEDECKTSCGADSNCLAYAFAAAPSLESENEPTTPTTCGTESKSRCIFYGDSNTKGHQVEISTTTDTRQEYVCTCKTEEDGTCAGAALEEVRNKFLMYLLGSIVLLASLFVISGYCLKCYRGSGEHKSTVTLVEKEDDKKAALI